MTKYTVPDSLLNIIERYAPDLPYDDSLIISDVINNTTFYITNLRGMVGITLHPNCVMLDTDFPKMSDHEKICILCHELVHVVQQNHWGWWTFMYRYLRQWKQSGFSYDKMKTFGIEKVAYDYQREVSHAIPI